MSSQLIVVVLVCILGCLSINNVHSFHTRLMGGRNPKRNEVKYLVAVQSQKALCGGGIVDDKFIVTAAHCIRINQTTGTLVKPTKIYAVINNTRTYDEKSAIIIDVVKAYIPKSMKLPYGDVAMLELERSLDIENNKEKLQKLELPEPLSDTEPITYPTFDDLTVKFAGFGHSYVEEKKGPNGNNVYVTSSSGPLQVAEAQIIDTKTCRNKYYGSFLTNKQICVKITEDKNLTNYQGVCTASGDSGSPVVFDNKVIVGVASFVVGGTCNTNIRPAVFTRISTYIDFITNAIKGNTSDMYIFSR